MRHALDLTGQRFGRLTVAERAPNTHPEWGPLWKCKCDCGNETNVQASHLRNGNTQSCGCFKKERIAYGMCTTHGEARTEHGSYSREWRAWRAMKDRCSKKSGRDYHSYAERGISVCPEWIGSFESFLSDMGRCPEGLTLDRIDNDLGYSLGNCRWATRSEQQLNRRPFKCRNGKSTLEVMDGAVSLSVEQKESCE